MSLSPGIRIGVYEVTAKIGEGGMGEVYQARVTAGVGGGPEREERHRAWRREWLAERPRKR